MKLRSQSRVFQRTSRLDNSMLPHLYTAALSRWFFLQRLSQVLFSQWRSLNGKLIVWSKKGVSHSSRESTLEAQWCPQPSRSSYHPWASLIVLRMVKSRTRRRDRLPQCKWASYIFAFDWICLHQFLSPLENLFCLIASLQFHVDDLYTALSKLLEI